MFTGYRTLIALALVILPLAGQGEVRMLDDTALAGVTGQAGLTIELQTQVSIGRLSYIDEGSFNVNDILLGGGGITAAGQAAGAGLLLDQIRIDIDVNQDGDAIIETHSLDGSPIDFGLTAGNITLEGVAGAESTTLVSDLSIFGRVSRIRVVADTADVGTGSGSLNVLTVFDVQDMDFDVPFLALGVRDLSITGAGENFDFDGDGGTIAAGTDTDGEFGLDPASPQFRELADFAQVELDLFRDEGLAGTGRDDQLRIDVQNFVMDVNVGQVLIGGTNAGSIRLDNLSITNTRLAIQGRD